MLKKYIKNIIKNTEISAKNIKLNELNFDGILPKEKDIQKKIEEFQKEIENLEEEIEDIRQEKFNHYYQDEIAGNYCYKIEIEGRTSLWENPKLFKEWFKREVFKKKEFKANENAWAIITEVIKEITDAKMDSKIYS